MRVSPNLLRRIDDARNMRRDYRLDMQPDLFGGVSAVQMKGWAFLRLTNVFDAATQESWSRYVMFHDMFSSAN